jgi:hypothetical protein
MRCNDMSPFSSSVSERKIMNHFVVKIPLFGCSSAALPSKFFTLPLPYATSRTPRRCGRLAAA